MSGRFRISMAKGGREALRPSYGQPKREKRKNEKGVGIPDTATNFRFKANH